MGKELILPSLEVRWFFYNKPESLVSWFNLVLPNAEKENGRTDAYLCFKNTDFVSVKLREYQEKNQLNLEFKLREKEHGAIDFGSNVIGNLESWKKWSTAVDYSAGDYIRALTGEEGNWNKVHKLRWLAKYSVENGLVKQMKKSDKVDTGCNIEYAEVTPEYNQISASAVLYTFALEAYSSDGKSDLMPVIKETINHVIQKSVPPEVLLAENSYGYPEWLEKIKPM